MPISGSYDPRLVALSVTIAIIASYTAFNLSLRIRGTEGRKSLLWLFGGAFAMGTGIWSMHFIGMLAFSLPVPITYSLGITILSLMIAITVSGFALHIVSRSTLGWFRLLTGAVLMGFGIAAMHYTGMAAMNMSSMIRYDPALFAVSNVIAIGASLVALRIVFALNKGTIQHRLRTQILSAVVMGAAITGMHYTGMAAARFPPDMNGLGTHSINTPWLAGTIGLASFMILSIALILSLVDSHLASRTASLVRSLRIANEKLSYMALHDGLTKLPNRRLLEDRVKQAIRHGRAESGVFSIIFMDLDRFKRINDYMGHHAGDKLLLQVAACLSDHVSPEDTVSRIGGDEFVIVLRDQGHPNKVHEVAKSLRDSIKGGFLIDDQPVEVSASFGISLYPHDGTDFRTLLVNADRAMYHAKNKGLNNIEFFSTEMNANANLRLEMENALRKALVKGEFVLHYQPKVTLGTGSIESVEALLRWNHPDRGLLFPPDFIPLAEDTGLIVPLGAWVIRQACLETKAWQNAGLPRIRVAVNLSTLQFHQQNLEEVIMEALSESGLDPGALELEITESLLMHDPERAMKTLDAIRSQGIRVAIDDFGTGYSSFSYLKRFPLDTLKIDRSFITEIDRNANDVAIVRTIITLGHSLNLRVIAEGVETSNQISILKSLDCDAYQGFYKTKPVPSDQLIALFRKGLQMSG